MNVIVKYYFLSSVTITFKHQINFKNQMQIHFNKLFQRYAVFKLMLNNLLFMANKIINCYRAKYQYNFDHKASNNCLSNIMQRYRTLIFTSSASLSNIRRNLDKCICLPASSPRPEQSVRYNDIALSTISNAYLETEWKQFYSRNYKK